MMNKIVFFVFVVFVCNPLPSFATDVALIQKGKTLFVNMGCVGCHGPGGKTEQGEFPRLAGAPAEYVVERIRYYKKGKKKDRAFRQMRNRVRRLAKGDILAIATYLASVE